MTKKKTTVYYLCDPKKNKQCKKTSCAYNKSAKYQNCKATTDYRFAQLDDKGNPIISAIVIDDDKVFTYQEC